MAKSYAEVRLNSWLKITAAFDERKGSARSYSEKSLGWAEDAATAGFLRAMPTTPRTVREEMAERGTKMRSVLELRSGGVSWTPLSRRPRRSLGTTPSRISPSV